jgi:Flp pilus assembly protein TadG
VPAATRCAQQQPPRRSGAGERGSASAELVLAVPLLLLLVLLTAQFAVYLHATHIAQAAAAQALAAARAEGGSAAAGQAEATNVLDQLGRSVLAGPRVSVDRGPAQARAEVVGTAQAVVPGLRLPVRAVAHGPVEQFSPDSG